MKDRLRDSRPALHTSVFSFLFSFFFFLFSFFFFFLFLLSSFFFVFVCFCFFASLFFFLFVLSFLFFRFGSFFLFSSLAMPTVLRDSALGATYIENLAPDTARQPTIECRESLRLDTFDVCPHL